MVRTRTFSHTLTMLVLAAIGLAAAPAVASAGVLASGYLVSSNAVRFTCSILNVGTKPITILSAKVYTDGGSPFADYTNCTTQPLAPLKRCYVTGPFNHMAGVVVVEGPTRQLRGTCTLTDAGVNAVATTEMR